MKELFDILCPEWKPLNEWSKDAKYAAISFVLIVIGYILAGIIENL